jgi:hypothetical protein
MMLSVPKIANTDHHERGAGHDTRGLVDALGHGLVGRQATVEALTDAAEDVDAARVQGAVDRTPRSGRLAPSGS